LRLFFHQSSRSALTTAAAGAAVEEDVRTTAVETGAGAAVAAGAASAVPEIPNSKVPDRTADAPAAANLLLIPLDKPPTSSFTFAVRAPNFHSQLRGRQAENKRTMSVDLERGMAFGNGGRRRLRSTGRPHLELCD
jgi:hypothetical protein